MAMKRTRDAVYSGEKYTDREGNEKTRFINIGVLMEGDDGQMSAKIESIPVGFNGWINFYEPKPKDGEQAKPAQSRPQRQATARNEPDDDLPPF